MFHYLELDFTKWNYSLGVTLMSRQMTVDVPCLTIKKPMGKGPMRFRPRNGKPRTPLARLARSSRFWN
ncbi:hypothetical protein AGR6A_Cc140056 [Agrobacterium sp. NCPPB 925]|nr:hypothetical protein AGR6A_Cc140056 [Agrobacterium sp. NCPPB 925]